MMSAKTERIEATEKKYMRMASESELSMTSTSRENRLVMRPRGVVSKKDMGARKTRVMACLSMCLDALVPTIVKITMKMNISRAWMAPRPA